MVMKTQPLYTSQFAQIYFGLTFVEAWKIVEQLGEDDPISVRLKQMLQPKADND